MSNDCVAQSLDKNGVSPQAISLPKGPGSIEGLGEAFKPRLNTGSAYYEVKIQVPEAVQGLAPELILKYDSGFGDGPLGVGWQLSVGSIRRKTERGVPRYVDTGDTVDNDLDGRIDEADEIDTILSPEGSDLVNVGSGFYRSRVEGSFSRYRKTGGGWEEQRKNGGRAYFGSTSQSRITSADGSKTYAWLLDKEIDPNGNTIEYQYTTLSGSDNQKYLSQIRWGAGSGPRSHYYLASFTYKLKPDRHTDYTAGFPIITSYRLQSVSVGLHGASPPHSQSVNLNHDGEPDSLVRNYRFSYASHALDRSRLQSITLYGSDNTNALPPLQFDYYQFVLPKQLSADGKIIRSINPPLTVMDNASAELIDLNRDGLADILRTTGLSQTVSINRGPDPSHPFGDIQWETVQGVFSNDGQANAINLADDRIHLADMDGDGLADLVQTSLFGNVSYFPNTGNLTWGNKTPMVTQDQFPPAPFTDSDVITADMDFDKRMDIVKSTSNGYTIWLNLGKGEYSRQIQTPGASWQGQTLRFSDPRVRMADMNGDRLLDVVKITPAGVIYAASRGHGNFAEALSLPIPEKTLTDNQSDRAQCHDLNGDGLSDLVIERASANELWFWLNKGTDQFDMLHIVTDLPEIYNPGTVTRWADINGNGTIDLIYADSNAGSPLRIIDLASLVDLSQPAELLKAIDNGLGVRTALSYIHTSELQQQAVLEGVPWTGTMPVSIPVVSREEVTTGLDLDTTQGPDRYVKEYCYQNPYYDRYRKTFTGFDSAVTTEIGDLTAPDLITTTHYFTGGPDGADNDGDGVVDEVSNDDIREEYPLTGRVRKQEQRDRQDNLYTREETDWKLKIATTGVDGTQIRFPYIQQTRELLFEGMATPEVIKTGFLVDDFGNVIEENRHGAESITGDEIITTRTYINDTTAWLIGLPETETVTNASGETAATSRFYYDGTEYLGLALGHAEQGNLTRRESWISGSSWLDAERYAYDSYGNRIGSKNGRGYLRSLIYDTDFHQFPVSEGLEVGNGMPDLTVSASYYPGFGKIKDYHDFNAAPTHFQYDAFGRVTKVVRPGDTETLPTETYQYTLSDPSRGWVYEYDSQGNLNLQTGVTRPNAVTVKKREVSGEVGTLDAIYYTDGLGRKLARYEEDVSGFVVNDAVLFNARAGEALRFLPYASPDSAYQVPSPALRHRQQHYDPLLRVVETINPETVNGRTSVSVSYLLLETRTLNEENRLKTLRKDGLDRIIEVQENNTGETYVTRYRYDIHGNLTQITDALNNVKQMQYDGLGRKTRMNDPDMGIKRYAYDDDNNLIRTVDAKNQVINYRYDGVNRILSEDYPDSTDSTPDIRYVYDQPSADYPATTFLKGRLSHVTDQSGAAFFSYDPLGRTVKYIKRIAYNGHTRNYLFRKAYDALGRVIRETAPNGESVTYTYNSRGLLESIPGYVDQVSYEPAGQFSTFHYANNTETTYTYDERNRIRSLLTLGQDNRAIQDLTYWFDGVSNITEITDGRSLAADSIKNATRTFSYDDLNRLTRARGLTWGTIDFQYDAIGNMVHKSSPLPGDPEHVDDPKINLGAMSYGGTAGKTGRIGRNPGDAPGPHAITATESGGETGGFTYDYDDNGNMISHAEGDVYRWNSRNRLIRTITPDYDTRYVYDYRGQRMIKSAIHKGEIQTVYYPSKTYEIREGKIIRHIFAGERRVAQVEQPFREFEDAQPKQFMTLKKGWNMVSLTVIPFNSSIIAILGDASDKITEIARYDSGSETFEVYEPNGTLQDFTTLEPGTGYLIRAIEAVTLGIPGELPEGYMQVKTGWNLLASTHVSTLSVSDALRDRIDDTDAVWYWNPSTQSYQHYFTDETKPPFLTTLSEIKPGTAYWLQANAPSTYTLTQPDQTRVLYIYPDHLGSTNIVADDQGNVINELQYYPFGRPRYQQTTVNVTAYKYTSKEFDTESELMYYEARHYDPVIGRFISIDPLFAEIGRKPRRNELIYKLIYKSFITAPQSQNLQSYSYNAPVTHLDRNGLWGEEIHRDKTIQWAQEVGFTEEQAKIIGHADNYVDNIKSGKSPIPVLGDQSYHFNTNMNEPDKIDSRLEHAREHMKRALEYKAKGDLESAYEELGKGLHALQDIYAHTDDLVTYNALKDLYHHLDHMEADDPYYKPNRIRNTEFATKQYLRYFLTH